MRDFDHLGLAPLPVEGGLWAQSHRGTDCSAIYYLLRAPAYSALHRLDRTEIFAFHDGPPARMLLLHPDGTVERPLLGLHDGAHPQVVVPAMSWQATEPLGEYSLLGTVVVPPYTEESVEFADTGLVQRYPGAASDISRLLPR